jgi:hypothetical protein
MGEGMGLIDLLKLSVVLLNMSEGFIPAGTVLAVVE